MFSAYVAGGDTSREHVAKSSFTRHDLAAKADAGTQELYYSKLEYSDYVAIAGALERW